MSRAQIRAQMAVLKRQINDTYVNNAKAGRCEPEVEAQDEGRISSMSMTMSEQVKREIRQQTSRVQRPGYSGPHIAGFAPEKQHMPVCTNIAHSMNTNNGYSRKPCGGFYFH